MNAAGWMLGWTRFSISHLPRPRSHPAIPFPSAFIRPIAQQSTKSDIVVTSKKVQCAMRKA